MGSLFLGLLELISATSPRRSGFFLGGLVLVGAGLAIVSRGAKGPFILAGLLIAVGDVAFGLMGVFRLIGGRDTPAVRRGTKPASDDWRPPDSEEVNKIVRGR